MTLTDSAAGLLAFSQRQLDRIAPPESRKKAWEFAINYANERPVLFAFFVTQATLSILPLLLFGSFVISTFLFAVGVALLFTLFWIGVALLLLVPTLLTTFSIGVGVWAWGVASVVVLRWLYGLVPYRVKGAETNGNHGKMVLHGQRNGTKSADGSATAAAHTTPNPATVPGGKVNGVSNNTL